MEASLIGRLRQLYSLNNLTCHAKLGSMSGQISTLLLLAIAAVLMFALMTANLGHVATTVTRVQNTADSASLTLASRLATKGQQMVNANQGLLRKCKKGSIWGIIGAVILAIVVIILYLTGVLAWLGALLTPVLAAVAGAGAVGATAAAIVAAVVWAVNVLVSVFGVIGAAGAVGGMIGGIIGGAIDTGSAVGALLGGLQGLGIGAAIGGGVSLASGALSPGSAAGGASHTATDTVVLKSEAAVELGGAHAVPDVVISVGHTIPPDLGGVGYTVVGGTVPEVSVTGAGPGAILTTPSASPAGSPLVGLSPTGDALLGWDVTTLGVGQSAMVPMNSTLISGLALGSPAAAGVGGALTAASRLAGAYVQSQIELDQFAHSIKQLAVLGEREQIRESIFLQTLSELVDDPNKTQGPGNPSGNCYFPEPGVPGLPVIIGDPDDASGRDDRTRSISCFQYWWNKRTESLVNATRDALAPTTSAIEAFFSENPPGPLERFKQSEAVQKLIGTQTMSDTTKIDIFDQNNAKVTYTLKADSELARQEVEEAGDGRVTRFFRDLYESPNTRTAIKGLWQPGPDKRALEQWAANDDCNDTTTCGVDELTGFDQIDALIGQLEGWVQDFTYFQQLKTDQLVASRDFWIWLWYDPQLSGDASTYYSDLGLRSQKIHEWLSTIETIKGGLAVCEPKFNDAGRVEAVNNAPCRAGSDTAVAKQLGGDFATSNGDLEDEFAAVKHRFEGLADTLDQLQRDIAAFYNQAKSPVAEQSAVSAWGGVNPVTYTWRDSRGVHAVKVEISHDFPIPTIRSCCRQMFPPRSCSIVTDPAENGDKTWVEITRQDPEQPFGGTGPRGLLWTWKAGAKPTEENAPAGTSVIKKRSHAYWAAWPPTNPNKVGLAR